MPVKPKKEYVKFTDDELATIVQQVHQGCTALDVWHTYFPHRSYHSVRSKVERVREDLRSATATSVGTLYRSIPATAHGAKDASPEQSDEEFLQEWFRATDRACRFYTEGNVAELTIDHDRPVLVSFSSDWHVSHSGATYARQLHDYLTALAATPDAIGLAVGDLLDMATRHNPTDMKGVPYEVRALRILLSKVKDRLIVQSGNHDERTTQTTGISQLAEACRELGIPFFRDDVCLFITRRNAAGDVKARHMVAARHAYYRDSTLNWTHKCWRWYESADWPSPPGDESGAILKPVALAIGHSHQGESATRTYGKKKVHGLALGPWQAGSRYSNFKGFTSSGPTAPTVVLPPTQNGPVRLIEDWRDALGAAPVAVESKRGRRAAA